MLGKKLSQIFPKINPRDFKTSEEILHHFVETQERNNGKYLPTGTLGDIMRCLGLIILRNRSNRPLLLESLEKDARLKSLIDEQVRFLEEESVSNLNLASLADGTAVFRFGNWSDQMISPVTKKLRQEFLDRLESLSPDHFTVLVRALSMRKGILSQKDFETIISHVKKSIDVLAHHNVRQILQAISEWPMNTSVSETTLSLMNRLRSCLPQMTPVDCLRALVTTSNGTSVMKSFKGDLKPRMIESILSAWESLPSGSRVEFLNALAIVSKYVTLMTEQEVKSLHWKVSRLAEELPSERIADFLYSVSLLRLRVEDINGLLIRFRNERAEAAWLKEKVDLLWGVAKLGVFSKSNVAFEILTKYCLPPKGSNRILNTANDEILVKLYDLYVICNDLGEEDKKFKNIFPDSWLAVLRSTEKRRVDITVSSKYGERIAGFLRGIVGSRWRFEMKLHPIGNHYFCPFFDEDNKIAIDIEPRSFSMPFNLRHKHILTHTDYAYCVVKNGSLLPGSVQGRTSSDVLERLIKGGLRARDKDKNGENIIEDGNAVHS